MGGENENMRRLRRRVLPLREQRDISAKDATGAGENLMKTSKTESCGVSEPDRKQAVADRALVDI